MIRSKSGPSASCIACALVVPLAVGCSALTAYIFGLLWNAVISPVFKAPALTFWQAWGIVIFLGIVGGFFKGASSR